MDGTGLKMFGLARRVSEITLDRKNQVIYYYDNYNHVRSLGYEDFEHGEDNIVVLIAAFKKVKSLEIIGDVLFWTTEDAVWFCKVKDRIYVPGRHSVSFKNALILKGVPSRYDAENPCEIDEACQQFCLLKGNSSGEKTLDYSCSCVDDYQLAENLRTCEPIQKPVSSKNISSTESNKIPPLFNASFVIRHGAKLLGMNLQSKNPTRVNSNDEDFSIFDAYLDQTVFWIDGKKSTIESLSKNYSSISYPKKWKPTVLRVDYLTEKIYLIDQVAGTVNLIDMLGKYHALVVSDLDNPCDLALDPLNGFMFIALHHHSVIVFYNLI